MTTALRTWRQTRRYQAMVSSLQSLSTGELFALGITPAQIPYLAFQASRL